VTAGTVYNKLRWA